MEYTGPIRWGGHGPAEVEGLWHEQRQIVSLLGIL